ncbi:pyrroloquinoline quinone precursor peptide PqqA [Roseicella aquatilis]|uniref:Coenzyme PQQ synthesis protein A n=1 Tax=Roseicella aquatilis TaxID=2527868 RepID=A0A4R4DRA6_9PROT|nr:pyrroloquinoline quinone precursor peptide PqqA [Roseicella aquatilis]
MAAAPRTPLVIGPPQPSLPPTRWRKTMSWTKPRVTEICLALEINAYALATL